MYKKECRACGCIGILTSLVFGALVGVLFAFSLIPNIVISVWIAFGLAVLSLIILIVAAFLASSERYGALVKCLCINGKCLLAGTIGTIIIALAALSIVLTPVFVSITILLSIGAVFFALMIISIICLISCIINALSFRR
ncbi:MAG: hypothetical protein RUMPE_00500 [Eubacteriales bacterium SKADARSKE-1]|nr:hypothetical protein [Eubacteriales bacterium SKADARSKE-1]